MNTILANTSSNSKTEYGLSALFNGISVATDVTAIVKITKNVERLKKLLDEAKEEEENIKKGIEELNKKYINYQKKINPNEYK
jgi:predicted nuclease with TOPRIM domain